MFRHGAAAAAVSICCLDAKTTDEIAGNCGSFGAPHRPGCASAHRDSGDPLAGI